MVYRQWLAVALHVRSCCWSSTRNRAQVANWFIKLKVFRCSSPHAILSAMITSDAEHLAIVTVLLAPADNAARGCCPRTDFCEKPLVQGNPVDAKESDVYTMSGYCSETQPGVRTNVGHRYSAPTIRHQDSVKPASAAILQYFNTSIPKKLPESQYLEGKASAAFFCFLPAESADS